MIDQSVRFLLGFQQPHHVRPKLRIACAGAIQVRLACGRRLRQSLIEDRPHTLVAVGDLTHRSGSSQGECAAVKLEPTGGVMPTLTGDSRSRPAICAKRKNARTHLKVPWPWSASWLV